MTTNNTIDLGDGHTALRHHIPREKMHELDQATAALKQAQSNLRSWVRPLSAMQGAADSNGTFSCTSPGQSGLTYSLSEVGGALLVDARDVATFLKWNFSAVPTQQPTSGLRVGLVFLDSATGQYLRFDGVEWAPVILN
jgi:hypothetical protein